MKKFLIALGFGVGLVAAGAFASPAVSFAQDGADTTYDFEDDLSTRADVEAGRYHEEARAQLIMMKRAVDKFKSEAEKPSTATNVLKFHLFNDRWGQLRSLLDTIHKLRGIHVAYTTKQIDDGHVSRDDAEKDLVNFAGWGGSYEFVCDAWTRGSKGRFFPQPRKIKGEHKITQRGAK